MNDEKPLTPAQLLHIAVEIHHQGDNLEQFYHCLCEAYQRADGGNKRILAPAFEQVIRADGLLKLLNHSYGVDYGKSMVEECMWGESNEET